MVRISTDHAEFDIALIHRFLSQESSWAREISLAVVEKAIANSLCFGLFLDKQQIGFARLVTDYATFAYLCDVFVIESQRGHGYARILLKHIMKMPVVAGLRRVMLTTSNAHGLFAQDGFHPLAHYESFMELQRPDIYLSE